MRHILFLVVICFGLVLICGCDLVTAVISNSALCEHRRLVVNTGGELLYCDTCGLDLQNDPSVDVGEVLSTFRVLIVDASKSSSVVDVSMSRYDNASSLILKDGITKVSNYAFQNFDKLVNISFPDSIIEISERAFRGCDSLKTVDLPDSLIMLWAGPFEDCISLSAIVLPASVEELRKGYINSLAGDQEIGVFQGCEGLRSFDFEEGSELSEIGAWSFRDCTYLDSFHMPRSVTFIGAQAFAGCRSLNRIVFEGTVDEWNAIEKEEGWNLDSVDIVICQNGTIGDMSDDVKVDVRE